MTDEDFTAMVVAEQRALTRLAWVLTGDREAARDLVKDALLRAYVHRRQLAGADSERAYLTADLGQRLELPATSPVAPTRPWRGRPGRGPCRRSERATLVAALDDLPSQQRVIVALRYIDDLSVAQTAAVLECSQQTVTTQSSRALRRLGADAQLIELNRS